MAHQLSLFPRCDTALFWRESCAEDYPLNSMLSGVGFFAFDRGLWRADLNAGSAPPINAPIYNAIVAGNAGADTTAPTITAFTLPATAANLTVAVTSLTATDDVGVTGYLITESATAPLVSDAGWTSGVPTNHTFASAGAKTLWAWAKDTAGNVSAGVSAACTITMPSSSNTIKAANGADGGTIKTINGLAGGTIKTVH